MFFTGLGVYFRFLNSDWSSGDYDYPSQTRFGPKSSNPVIVEEISRNEYLFIVFEEFSVEFGFCCMFAFSVLALVIQ